MGHKASAVANLDQSYIEEGYINSYKTAPRGEYVLEDNGFFDISSKGVHSIAAMKRLEEESAKKRMEQQNIQEPKRFNGFAYKNKYQ